MSIGHNTPEGTKLKQFVTGIEHLEAEKAETATEITEKYAEAKAEGFDTKIIRKIVKDRKLTKVQRDEQQALYDVYMHAIGDA